MDQRVIPAIIVVMVAILFGIAVLVYFEFRPEPAVPFSSGGDVEFAGPSIDSGARIEIEVLRSQIEALQNKIEQLEKDLSRVAAMRGRSGTDPLSEQNSDTGFLREGPNQIIDAYDQVVLIANRRNVNKNLKIASPSYLVSVFGRPREALTSTCQPMTNQRLASKLRTEQVGPIRVRMLEPAIESLRTVFEKIKAADPDLHDRINTVGALCVRHIRGSPRSVSTHAFGLSLDLNIDGHLDQLGDGKTQLGLTILADFFRNEGWFWGASFSREDSMHFEVSRDLVDRWIAEGKL